MPYTHNEIYNNNTIIYTYKSKRGHGVTYDDIESYKSEEMVVNNYRDIKSITFEEYQDIFDTGEEELTDEETWMVEKFDYHVQLYNSDGCEYSSHAYVGDTVRERYADFMEKNWPSYSARSGYH